MHPAVVAATDAVAVGVTVVATLVVVALLVAVVFLLGAVRDLRRQADDLGREADQLLDELGTAVHEAGLEVERVERMVGSAEAISDVVGSASRLVGGALAAPFIKLVALGSGVARGLRLMRRGGMAELVLPARDDGRRRHRGQAGRGTPGRSKASAVRPSTRAEPRRGAGKSAAGGARR